MTGIEVGLAVAVGVGITLAVQAWLRKRNSRNVVGGKRAKTQTKYPS